MGFFDTVKNKAGALAADAGRAGKVTAAQVGQFVMDAVREGRFYIYSHPKSLTSVQTRLEDIMLGRNPTDPFSLKPEIGEGLRQALRALVHLTVVHPGSRGGAGIFN